jgi:small subunit ribosomal protein S1
LKGFVAFILKKINNPNNKEYFKMANTDNASSTSDSMKEYLMGTQNFPKTYKRGQIVKGKVVSSNKGEIVVDVEGRAEGVVSGREMKMDGEKIEVQDGDDILVYVLKGENSLGQIELSIRRTGTARKWFELNNALKDDKPIKVQVIEANTGGVIVNVGGGLRGFVPTSQLDNTRIYPLGGYSNKQDADKELQAKLAELISKDLEVKVIEIDREKNRVIFSEKLVTARADVEKRQETLKKVKSGDRLDGNITGIAPFGLFINAQGLEGLVHLSEISWDKVTNPADFYKVGDKVNVEIIGIEDGGKRVAYSIKRLQSDPWDAIVQKYKVSQRVVGEVTKIVDYGAFVRIEDGLNGLIHISELSEKLVKDPNKIVELGKKYELEIISISKEDRHLGLSLKRVHRIATYKPRVETQTEVKVKEETVDKKDVSVTEGAETLTDTSVTQTTVEEEPIVEISKAENLVKDIGVSPEMERLKEFLDEDDDIIK